jgi:hypothetical protein
MDTTQSKRSIDFAALTLEQLSEYSLFKSIKSQRDWREVRPLIEIGASMAEVSTNWLFHRDPSVFEHILPMLPSLNGELTEYDVIYCWNAYALAAVGQIAKAESILTDRLNKEPPSLNILSIFGDIKLHHLKIEALGWYMQCCYHGTPESFTYLKLSAAAYECGEMELYNRLLVAADILALGIFRLDSRAEHEIRSMVSNESPRMQTVLKTFRKYMKNYLPLTSLLSKDWGDRLIILSSRESRIIDAGQLLISRKL